MNFNFKGLTNDIKIDNLKVIKVSKDISEKYLDKQNEINVLIAFMSAKQEIMIKPRTIDFENNHLVSSFKILINYKSLEEIEINHQIIDLVVNGINQFHDIKFDFSFIKRFNYADFLKFFKENIKKPLYDLSQNINKVLEYANDLQQLPAIISHNDLVPGNILIHKNNDLKFIDYDYVQLNDKFFDLASFITETLNDKKDLIDYFVKKAIKNNLIEKNELHILNKCIAYQDVLWTLWANYMYENTNEYIYLQIAQEKYQRSNDRYEIVI
ncbi:phosphotransferase family protein [Spiroplasma tabanidicola]|uniref:Choline kinase n=1 Tax=Spiroplasma tabanidicola TaxID=324079 RepID=A0A6I6CCK5_9MOLU|nr:phosphotransferase [Spiroplasma tabanidicola]QGS51862.1 choline kinase [Spiroplasma tabanidicola]